MHYDEEEEDPDSVDEKEFGEDVYRDEIEDDSGQI